VVRNTRNDHVRLEKQRALDEQRVLVVQQVLPQATRHELRKDDRHVAARIFLLHVLDVLEQRLHQRAKG
jgi:hypothetical protein